MGYGGETKSIVNNDFTGVGGIQNTDGSNTPIAIKTILNFDFGNTLKQAIFSKTAPAPIGIKKGYFKIPNFFQCEQYINDVDWVYREIYGTHGKDWSLKVQLTECGLNILGGSNVNESFEELYKKTPLEAKYCDNGTCILQIPWNKELNTELYWSMYNQYICHVDWAKFYKKFNAYHIDPWRKEDKGYWGNVSNKCN